MALEPLSIKNMEEKTQDIYEAVGAIMVLSEQNPYIYIYIYIYADAFVYVNVCIEVLRI